MILDYSSCNCEKGMVGKFHRNRGLVNRELVQAVGLMCKPQTSRMLAKAEAGLRNLLLL